MWGGAQARLDHEDEVGATSNRGMQQRAALLEARVTGALATRTRGFYLQHGLQVRSRPETLPAAAGAAVPGMTCGRVRMRAAVQPGW